MDHRVYGVRELQAHLGEALRAVQGGGTVTVTSRGRPVAVLSSPERPLPGASPLERRLRRLAAEGRLILGRGGPIGDYRVARGSGLAARLLRDRR